MIDGLGSEGHAKAKVLINVNFSAELSGTFNLECHILDLTLSITVIEKSFTTQPITLKSES